MSNGPEFYQTGYGRTYYEHQLPTIMKHLDSIAKELKRSNDLKELELKTKESDGDELQSQEELDERSRAVSS
jgi:hypothetical protein